MVFLPYLCSEFFEIWFIWNGDFSPFRLDCNILHYSSTSKTLCVMKKQTITNSITLDNFAFVAGVGTYELTTSEGVVVIEMTKKQSNFGKGELTVYDCIVTGVDGTKTTYTEKPIGYYKRIFGAVVNHREGTVTTAKVMTEEDITNAVLAWEGKILATAEKLQRIAPEGYDLLIVPCKKDTKELLTLPDCSAVIRSQLIERSAKAQAEKAAAEKAQAERKEKAERKDIAKAVMTADGIQAEIMKAVIAGDFAKVAELTAQAQAM